MLTNKILILIFKIKNKKKLMMLIKFVEKCKF